MNKVRRIWQVIVAGLLLLTVVGCTPNPTPTPSPRDNLPIVLEEWEQLAEHYGEAPFEATWCTVTNGTAAIPDVTLTEEQDVQVSDENSGLWERVTTVEELGKNKFLLANGVLRVSADHEGQGVAVAWRVTTTGGV